MASYDYNDPKSSLQYLLNPNVPLPETDTRAAESAVAMGGMGGGQFAANNRLRLRDSERIQRLALGQQLLNPYLQRESAEKMQGNQLAAEAARQAVTESGALQRLTQEGQQALQRAILNGNQQQAHDLLTEAGANSRQAATIAAGLQTTLLNNQQRNFEALLPYQQHNLDIRRSTLPRYASQPNPVVMNGGAGGGFAPVTASGASTRAPAAPATRSSGSTLSMVDNILAQYGIGGRGRTPAPAAPSDPYANWRAALPAPIPGGANWTPETGAPWGGTDTFDIATQDWRNAGSQPNEFDWQYAQDPEIQAAQNYYE